MLKHLICAGILLCAGIQAHARDEHIRFLYAAVEGVRKSHISHHLETEWSTALQSVILDPTIDARDVFLTQLRASALDFDRFPQFYERVLNRVQPEASQSLPLRLDQLESLLTFLGNTDPRITKALEPYVESSLAYMKRATFEREFTKFATHPALPSLMTSFLKGIARAKNLSFQEKLGLTLPYLETFEENVFEAFPTLAYLHPHPAHQRDQVVAVLRDRFWNAPDHPRQLTILASVAQISTRAQYDFLFEIASHRDIDKPIRHQAKSYLLSKLDRSERMHMRLRLSLNRCQTFFMKD